jgi:putative ABC transport system permease protein
MLPSMLPRLINLETGLPLVACAIVVSIATGTLCGFPRIGTRGTLHFAGLLKDGQRTTGAGSRSRLRSGLVIGQIALSLMLLVAAGLMGRGFVQLLRTDRGFDPTGLLTLHVTLPFEKYKDDAVRVATLGQLLQRAMSLPGVTSVGAVTGYPSSSMGTLGGGPLPARVAGAPSTVTAILRAASPTYFTAMRTSLVAGRPFSDRDRADAPPVAIVTETLARAYWNEESPVGKPLVIPAAMSGFPNADVTATVVGVVADMRFGKTGSPSLFVPIAQRPSFWTDLVVRTDRDPATLTATVRRALLDIEGQLLVEQIAPMTTIIGDRIALEKTQSVLVGIFSGLATVLSAVGLYGLLAQLVAHRLREIGVRRAIGAQSADILRLVMRRGLNLAALGAIGGMAGAFAIQRLVGSRVFGLSSFDARIVIGSATVLVAIALLASYVPARRAIRVDPMIAMR